MVDGRQYTEHLAIVDVIILWNDDFIAPFVR